MNTVILEHELQTCLHEEAPWNHRDSQVDYDDRQMDLIASRLLAFKSKLPLPANRRSWENVVNQLSNSEIRKLAPDRDGNPAISTEALRRFAKREQILDNWKLVALVEFLQSKEFLSEEELDGLVAGENKIFSSLSLGNLSFEISNKDYVDLQGVWSIDEESKIFPSGASVRRKIEVIASNSKGFRLMVEEWIEVDQFSALGESKKPPLVRRCSGLGAVVPLHGNGFLIAIQDTISDNFRLYLSATPIFDNKNRFLCLPDQNKFAIGLDIDGVKLDFFIGSIDAITDWIRRAIYIADFRRL